MNAPTLTTDRLTLRPHQIADFEPYAAFWASERARFMGGPVDRNAAWKWFAVDVAQWPLLNCGALAVTETATGRLVGQVGLNDLPNFPERELGWLTFEEGQGFATEAARALRNYAFDTLGWTTLVSYIDRDNHRSIALAERLGARRDPAAIGPDPEDLVYRHDRGAA